MLKSSVEGFALISVRPRIFFRRKTNMKKVIALLLALVMVFGLVACGAKPDSG